MLACYMQSKNVEMCAVGWLVAHPVSQYLQLCQKEMGFVARALDIHTDLQPPLFSFFLFLYSLRRFLQTFVFVSSLSPSTLFDHLPGN